MAEKALYQLLDLGGGINQGLPATQIPERESPDLLNLYPYGPSLKRRPGIVRVTNSLGLEMVTPGRFHSAELGQSALIVGAKADLYSYSGGNWSQLWASALPETYRPWTFIQYNRIGLFCRVGYGTLRWWRPGIVPGVQYKQPSGVGSAGIAAPATAPTLADAGAGTIETSGDYTGVVTFYDADTGAESDPSDPSAAVTLAGNRNITWSSIPTSTNVRVTHVRLYRSLADQPGVYYFVAAVTNGTTGYTDSSPTDDLGSAASFRNGLPPDVVEHMALFREHLFTTDGTELRFSEPGLPESFHALNQLTVSPDDGGRIVGLCATPDRLIVAKTTGIWYVTGEDRGNFEVHLLSAGHGCVAGHTLRWSNGLTFWLGEREVWASDGGTPVPIGTPKLQTFLDNLTPDYFERITATVYEPMGWYILSVPDTSENDDWPARKRTQVYCIREQAWVPWRWDASSFAGTATNRSLRGAVSFTDTDGTPRLLGVLDGLWYVYDLFDQVGGAGGDRSAPSYTDQVSWVLTTKRLAAADRLGHLQTVRRVSMLTDWGTPDGIDVNLLDDAGASRAYRGVYPLAETERDWQHFNIDAMDKPSSFVQLKLSGGSDHAFAIHGLQILTLQHQRQRRAV